MWDQLLNVSKSTNDVDTADRELVSPDEMLAERSSGRDDAAFGAVVARFGDAVYCIARNMCATSSEADEVALNTFIFAHECIASLPTDASLRSWLCGTAVKIALTRRLSAGRGTTHSLEKFRIRFDEAGGLVGACGEWPDQSDPSLECSEVAGLLRLALEHVDARFRAAFVLSDLAALSPEETASILQTSPQDIRAQIHCTRLILREVLDAFFKRRTVAVHGSRRVRNSKVR